MIHRFLVCFILLSLAVSPLASAQPMGSNAGPNYGRGDETWDWSNSSEESATGSSYLGVDIEDVSADRLGALKLNEEHGVEVTTVDQDAPAGKAGLHEHDVILSLNGTPVESTAQLRRMIKETPPGRIVSLGISRDGQPMTIKVQLADRHKSMAWEPNMPAMPEMPKMPAMPDFDLPVSVVVVHQLARSGLMVENITPQLGDFFGVKDGKGVLVRSVEKGSRGEKAGFRAGDVVVKVNNQPVHDTSDFTHAIHSVSGPTAAITVMREKREQNLTLTLPEKKDSGNLIDERVEIPDLTAETQQAIARAGEVFARLTPAILEKIEQQATKQTQKQLRESERKLQQQQQRMQEQEHKLRHARSRDWADI
ncbi:MAG: PDZ domain-containing protein [Terriglobales bacterium]